MDRLGLIVCTDTQIVNKSRSCRVERSGKIDKGKLELFVIGIQENEERDYTSCTVDHIQYVEVSIAT